LKGALFAACQTTLIAASAYVWGFRSESYHEDQAEMWYDRYQSLGAKASQSEFDRMFRKYEEHLEVADSRRRLWKPFLAATLVVYLANAVDVALHRDTRAVRVVPAAGIPLGAVVVARF